MKQKKARFRTSINPVLESQLSASPKLKRIYHRYDYSRKKMQQKISRMILHTKL